MTTFKGYMRSWERAYERSLREAAKVEKLRQKQQMLANAAQAVKEYNELLTLLTSLHKETIEPIDWQGMLEEPAPPVPAPGHQLEEKAAKKLTNYTPSFLDKLFGMTNSKKKKLERALIDAQKKDVHLNEEAKKAYVQQLEQWEKMQKISKGTLAHDPSAYRDAVEFFHPFSGIVALGTYLNFDFTSEQIVATLMVNTEEIVPKQVLSLTSTGKLSQKDMSSSKFNELYQDHVCSCLLRVARETLTLCPVNSVLVNSMCDQLNPVTGQIEPQILVSAIVFPDTLTRLNFTNLDPSDAMKNFKHTMSFSKTGGFKPVKPVEDITPSVMTGPSPSIAVGPTNAGRQTQNTLDQKIISIYKEQGALHAVKYYKDQSGSDLKASKDYVDNLAAAAGLK